MRTYRLIVDPDKIDIAEMNRRRDETGLGRQKVRDRMRAERFNQALEVLQGYARSERENPEVISEVIADMLELMKVST